MNDIPDATTVAFFRERLRKAGVIEELFEMFEAYLRSQGLQPVLVYPQSALVSAVNRRP